MKPTISKPFKSNDRTFDKVYNAFDKRDYFNSQGLAKTQKYQSNSNVEPKTKNAFDYILNKI